MGVRQRVEILKALYRNSSILILDEPTAVLTPQEVADLFLVLRELKADGKSIIIITHKLKETMHVADRITVLRKGKNHHEPSHCGCQRREARRAHGRAPRAV